MFVELTISQADGDSSKFEVLKPINEQIAIKRFADGLRNDRISTIIAARNYSHLKDAISAAKDEEATMMTTGPETIMKVQGKGYFFNSSDGRINRNFSRGSHRNSADQGQFNRNDEFRGSTYTRNRGFQSNRGFRGRNFYYRGRGTFRNTPNQNVNVIQEENNVEGPTEGPVENEPIHFFRS